MKNPDWKKLCILVKLRSFLKTSHFNIRKLWNSFISLSKMSWLMVKKKKKYYFIHRLQFVIFWYSSLCKKLNLFWWIKLLYVKYVFIFNLMRCKTNTNDGMIMNLSDSCHSNNSFVKGYDIQKKSIHSFWHPFNFISKKWDWIESLKHLTATNSSLNFTQLKYFSHMLDKVFLV